MQRQLPKRVPFAFTAETKDLADAIIATVARNTSAFRNEYVSPRNQQHFKHGQSWTWFRHEGEDTHNELTKHETYIEVSLQDIRDHNLDVLPKFIQSMVEDMSRQFARDIYSMIEQSSDQAGTAVKNLPFPAAFIEALRRVEFGVNWQGVPEAPTFHSSPELAAQLREKTAPSDEEAIREIMEQKSRQALAREAQRVSRYRF